MTAAFGKPAAENLPFYSEEVRDTFWALRSVAKPTDHRSAENAEPSELQLSSLAKRIHAARAKRAQVFGLDIFAEPGWDMLLSLYVAEREGYRMTVSAICNDSGVPDTTALRWVERLTEMGLTRRVRNPFDLRSSFVELSPEGIDKMDLTLRTWHGHFVA